MMKNANINKKDIQNVYNAVKSNNGSIYMSALKEQIPIVKLVKALDLLKEKGIVSLGIDHVNGAIQRVVSLN